MGFRDPMRGKAYRAWRDMLDRCYKPSTNDFAHYGGRGISVCDRWRRSFADFLEDMGPPSPELSLDRENNDGNYEPSNCRWATRSQQRRNRRVRPSPLYEHDGKRLYLDEWCELVGIKKQTITYRLKKGMSFSDAITKSPNRGNRFGKFSGD